MMSQMERIVRNRPADSRSPTLANGHDEDLSAGSGAEEEMPEVIRSWGGERVWSVWMCYTTFLILLLLAPINGIQQMRWFVAAQASWVDKLVHLGLFTTLTGVSGCAMFPFCRDPSTTIEKITPGRMALLIGVVSTLAIGLEFAQPCFGRSFEWFDMATNLVSIIPGFGLFLILNEVRHFIADQSA